MGVFFFAQHITILYLFPDRVYTEWYIADIDNADGCTSIMVDIILYFYNYVQFNPKH